MILLLRLQ